VQAGQGMRAVYRMRKDLPQGAGVRAVLSVALLRIALLPQLL